MTTEQNLQNQFRLCYDGSHNATKDMLAKFISKLTAQRTDLVQAWRDGGKQDVDWLPIAELDVVIDKQERILMSMERVGA
jgi:hypothetical protein